MRIGSLDVSFNRFGQLHFVLHVVLQPLAVLSDRGDVSAVNDVFASSDRGRSIGNEKCNQFCDFCRSAGATERNPAQRIHRLCLAATVSVPASAANRSIKASAALVSVNPGATLLTRMPCGATSLESPLL